MFNLIIILFQFSVVHESLTTTQCSLGPSKIKIERINKNTYVFYDEKNVTKLLTSPKIEDKWDSEYKQMFDTYSFKHQKINLILKRPETKGTIENTIALFNDKVFICRNM